MKLYSYRGEEDDYEAAMKRAEAEGVKLSAVLQKALRDYARGKRSTRFPTS